MDYVEIAYLRKLRGLLKKYRKDVNEQIVPLVKRDNERWADEIGLKLDMLYDHWLSDDRTFNTIAGDFVGLAFNRRDVQVGIDVYGKSERINQYLRAAVKQNVSLIQSIATDYHDQVENIVLGNMRQGMRSSHIVKELSEQYGVRERHAKFIARDQTAKARGEIAKLRQEDAGYEYFKWETMHDERVRHAHSEVAARDVGYGKGIFRWDDLPLVNGRPLYPGADYQCRCFAKPIRVLPQQ